MGFLDKLRDVTEAAQRVAQEQLRNVQQQQPQEAAGTGQPYQQPDEAAAEAPVPPGPDYPPAQQVVQSFNLERALVGTVGVAEATWRRWPASRWAHDYPNLGTDRFQCILKIPAGAAGSSPLELELTLDPFRPNGGYRTPGFSNEVELREVGTGRRWRADSGKKSLGPIVVNADGVSGTFKRVYLRSPDRPADREAFVILEGVWRAA